MRKILLVEDEKMIRYGIYVMIENSGVPYQTIVECKNGKEAIECMQRETFDLLLTDIRMPVMDGIELVKWIHMNIDVNERPFIVAISGYSEFEYVKSMMQYQAVDYLLKPVDREELSKVIWKIEEKLREKGVVTGEASREDNTENSLTPLSKKKMQQATDYINKNLARPIDMAEVSNVVSMNYSMFSAIFKEYMGENFSTYLKKLRIEKSIKLLDNTDMNIKEIAEAVGFADGRCFAKAFKERMGCSPMAYREK